MTADPPLTQPARTLCGVSRPRSIVGRSHEAFNARDWDRYRELLDEKIELVISGTTLCGRAAVTDYLSAAASTRSGLRIASDRTFVETEDALVIEIRMMDEDDSRPDSVAVEYSICGLYRVAGGRIVEWRVYLDASTEQFSPGAFAAVFAEQSALRRVAELVACQAPSEQVFDLVTEELGRLMVVNTVRLVRFEPDGSAAVLAARGVTDDRLTTGTSFSPPPGSPIENVFRTGRPARVDDFGEVQGRVGVILREQGAGAGVAGPIVVDGRVWGAMAIGAPSAEALPPGSEERVARFAELISTAVSNIESTAKVERLVTEQSALRRVATLVARRPAAEEVFELVTEELDRLLDVSMARTVRFEPDGSFTVMAARGVPMNLLPRNINLPRLDGGILDQVFRTGRPGRVDDYTRLTGSLSADVREAGIRSAAAGPIVVDGQTWGAMAVASERALSAGTEDRVAQFAELVSTAISNIESQSRVERLASEQSALRRVADLVAHQAPPERVYALVTEELSSLLGVSMVRTVRLEPDGTVTVLAAHGIPNDGIPPGSNVPVPEGSLIEQVFSTGRPARLDDYGRVRGPIGRMLREQGARSGVGGPIVVDGRLWGAMVVGARSAETLPPGSEERVAQFAELVSTAISNVESLARVERLAAEESALRRIATLVAREHSPEDLFATLAEELGVLLDVDASTIVRYEADSSATVVAGWSDGTITLPVGERFPLEGENLAGTVLRTGEAQRKGHYEAAGGTIAATVRELGFRSAVATPIVVEESTWGAIAVLSTEPDPLPLDTESRLAQFSRHASVAVANAKSRADLAQSRVRIVQAGDEARWRFERDLHDGAQQRLVSLGLELLSAEATVPRELGELRARLSDLARGLNGVLDQLRELSRGLHPAVLSEDGLTPALGSLARTSPVPVDLRLELGVQRFAQPIEVAAYYVVSEALTNTAKHAQASHVEVVARRSNAWLELSVGDDGRGGADAASGSGLTGLVDRVEALGGTIQVDSAVDGGTAIRVKLPTEPPEH
jgi:signal transduction histidine kinase/ketosteroid isomerase-like protein